MVRLPETGVVALLPRRQRAAGSVRRRARSAWLPMARAITARRPGRYTGSMKQLLIVLTLSLFFLAACSDGPAPGDAGAAGAANESASPAGSLPASARQLPPFDPMAFTLVLEPVLDGFSSPVFVGHAGDGSGRLFVVEQGGTIRVVVNGQVLPEPFLDVRSLVVTGGERGLLGVAFHPRYAENGRFFIAYTARNGDNTVARYRVSADPNRADPASATVLFALPDPAPNHNGGMLAFGPDGYLYVGTGDSGGSGDPRGNGQNLGTLFGKMLRLDVDAGEPYGVPPDNPFVGQGGARPEIWALGLRNPWRYSFDRATGDLWIADVGQNAYEEINLQRADSRGGENYGWNRMEGMHCFPIGSRCDADGLTLPVAEYPTRRPECSVTGGYVYRRGAQPALTGGYFYADYCSGRIWSLHQAPEGAWVQTELLDTDLTISSFGEDEASELYLLDHRGGRIYRLTAAPR